MKDIIESWSQDVNLRSQARRQVILEMIPNAQNKDAIPDDLGLYKEIRNLTAEDVYNHYNGIIRGYAISKDKVQYFEGPITPQLLNQKPLFLIMKVTTDVVEDDEYEERMMLRRMILKCNDYFEKEYEQAKSLALKQARADLF